MLIKLAAIFFSMILVNNYVLVKFYGICPFLGVSKKLDSAVGMSGAVIFVMFMATAVTFPLQIFVLNPAGLSSLQTIVFILVIAVLVQFIEIFLKKYVVAPVSYTHLPPQNDTINMLSSNCPCTSAPAWAWGQQFKQKTAYEIMSGDWSSDVCSSDLLAGLPGPARQHRPHQHHDSGSRRILLLRRPDGRLCLAGRQAGCAHRAQELLRHRQSEEGGLIRC